MGLTYKYPPVLRGTPEEQIRQIYKYLFENSEVSGGNTMSIEARLDALEKRVSDLDGKKAGGSAG